jgi:hypothetical protein
MMHDARYHPVKMAKLIFWSRVDGSLVKMTGLTAADLGLWN